MIQYKDDPERRGGLLDIRRFYREPHSNIRSEVITPQQNSIIETWIKNTADQVFTPRDADNLMSHIEADQKEMVHALEQVNLAIDKLRHRVIARLNDNVISTWYPFIIIAQFTGDSYYWRPTGKKIVLLIPISFIKDPNQIRTITSENHLYGVLYTSQHILDNTVYQLISQKPEVIHTKAMELARQYQADIYLTPNQKNLSKNPQSEANHWPLKRYNVEPYNICLSKYALRDMIYQQGITVKVIKNDD